MAMTLPSGGVVDDETATISLAGIRDRDRQGLVERNGTFWFEDLPLREGVTKIILTARDAAGNSTTQTISVVKGGLRITMNAVEPEELIQGVATVSGTIQERGFVVFVNGVRATMNSNGTWLAREVPATPGGTGSFYATAVPEGQAEQCSRQLKKARSTNAWWTGPNTNRPASLTKPAGMLPILSPATK